MLNIDELCFLGIVHDVQLMLIFLKASLFQDGSITQFFETTKSLENMIVDNHQEICFQIGGMCYPTLVILIGHMGTSIATGLSDFATQPGSCAFLDASESHPKILGVSKHMSIILQMLFLRPKWK